MTILQKIKNWLSAENPAKLWHWKNIWGFIQGEWRLHVKTTDHIKEQVEWRATEADKVCTGQGFCKSCGCSFPDKFYEDRSCDNACYPDMMTAKQWETYKKYLQKKA